MHLLWLQRLHSVDQIAVFEEGYQTPLNSLFIRSQHVVRFQPKHICLEELVHTHNLAPDELGNWQLVTVMFMGFVCVKLSMAPFYLPMILCNVSEPYHPPHTYRPPFHTFTWESHCLGSLSVSTLDAIRSC